MGAGSSFPRINRPGREADHSPSSSAEVINACSYTSALQYAFMAWCLVKHRDNFTFYFSAALSCVASHINATGNHKAKRGVYRADCGI